MNYEEKQNAMVKLCSVYRGMIIHQAIEVETMIELIITDIIGGEKRAMSDFLAL